MMNQPDTKYHSGKHVRDQQTAPDPAAGAVHSGAISIEAHSNQSSAAHHQSSPQLESHHHSTDSLQGYHTGSESQPDKAASQIPDRLAMHGHDSHAPMAGIHEHAVEQDSSRIKMREHPTGHLPDKMMMDHPSHDTSDHYPGGTVAAQHVHGGDHAGKSHQHHDPNIFKNKFWLSLLLTIPVLAFSQHFLHMIGLTAPHFGGGHYIPPLFGTLVFIVGGIVFLQGGVQEIKQRQPGMMTLIALAITVSYSYSLITTLGYPGQEIYWELTTLIDIMLLGHWLEMRAVQNAGSALDEIARLLPDTALRIAGDTVSEVPIAQLKYGDILIIKPGARIPVDGEVILGESHVNQSMITGESLPVRKHTGDNLIAGTINVDGAMRMRVDRTGNDTYLAGIMRLVEEAQSSKSRSQILADRAAFWLVITAITSALVTAMAWGMSGASSQIIMERVVTVMVAACPHALGLAIPLVIAISTALCARAGLLVRNRLMFEAARNINCVVFDKTGTLTRGEHRLTGIIPAADISADEVLRLAAAAEKDAEHMLARAIVEAAAEKGLEFPQVSGFASMPGRGISAVVDDHHIEVGGPNLLTLSQVEIPIEINSDRRAANEDGDTIVYLLIDGNIKGMLLLSDAVKDESREAIDTVKSMGIRVAMLTGDNQKVAEQVSRQLGIDEFFAGILPKNKAAIVQELQKKGFRVAMVGDGVNDAPALVQADVGIAIGAGTDVAVESAGIILVRSDPRDVAQLLMISRATYSKMVQNLAWATAYNLVVIPLAAGILAPWGFVLPMAAGAIVMSLSTILVALNAQLLRKLQPAVIN